MTFVPIDRAGRRYLAGPYACAFLLSLLLQAATASAQRASRRAQSPEAQSAASVSFMERTILFPATGLCDFDYFVDSEAGHDFLRLRAGATLLFEASGRNRAGRARVAVPPGSVVLRVAYEKDSAGASGRDMAWIDNLRCVADSLFESYRFDELVLQAPAGWQVGGAAGGWRVGVHDASRALRRPAAGSFTGYQPVGVVTASERTIDWPANGQPSQRNTLHLAYFVDSEEGHDFFKVFVDGVEQHSVSGTARSGKVEIDVGAAGPHLIRLEYIKDDSVDEGLDDARVLHLEARVDGVAFEVGGLDGQSAGTGPEGWQASLGVTAGWVVAQGIESRAYVSPAAPTVEPVVDGQRDSAYSDGTKLRLVQQGNITAQQPGETRVLLSSTTHALSVLLSAPAQTGTLGDEQGSVTLYLDAQHQETLRGQGCGRPGATPGPEDRKLRLNYDWPAASASVPITVEQHVGTCDPGAPWQVAQSAQQLAVVGAVAESPDGDPGFVSLEFQVTLPAVGMLEQDLFGFAVSCETVPGQVFRLPAFDNRPVLDDDVSSWESVYLGATSRRAPNYVLIDGAPKPPDTDDP